MEFPNKTNSFLRFIKPLVPLSLRFKLRRIHQRKVFRKAINDFRAVYKEIEDHPGVINDLIYGWGNMGWSSFQDYTMAVIRSARSTKGPILECGSGLSTLLMGIIAQERGYDVYTLEHEKQWANHVSNHLQRLQIDRVKVCYAPLQQHNGFKWYDTTALPKELTYQLVICDGPPQYGDRYGLLPLMAGSLSSESIVLLDDFQKQEEKLMVEKWKEEFKVNVREEGTNDIYANITFPRSAGQSQ